LDGVFTGRISDNHGTAVRSNSPFRFWRKIAIWLLFYILVAASPIGIALQESAKTSAASEHPPAGDIQKAVSDE